MARRINFYKYFALFFVLTLSLAQNDSLNIEVNKIAKTIASKSPLVTRVIKKQINYARDHSVKESLDYHAAWNSSLISGSDMQEAMTSYMNKTDGTYDDLEELKSFWEKNEGLV